MTIESPVIILGTGRIGRLALEIFKSNEVLVYGFLTDDEKEIGQEFQDVTIMGHFEDEKFLALIGKSAQAFIATEDIKVYKKALKVLKKHKQNISINAIHRDTILAQDLHLSLGNLVGPGVTLNAAVRMGTHNLVMAGTTLAHHATVGNHCVIGAGVTVSPTAEIGNRVVIGAGAIIASGVKIGDGAQVGPGSVVMRNVEEEQTVFGNPAQPVG